MATKQALFVLASGLVLARDIFVTQGPPEMAETMGAIRLSGKPLKIVDNAASFFNADNLLKLIKKGDKDYNLVAEQAGVTLYAADVAAIQRAEVVAAEIAKKMIPDYPFADVPEGWSFAADVSYGDTKVRRKRANSQGDVNTHYLSPAMMEKMWQVASKKWADPSYICPSTEVRNADYRRLISVTVSQITVGCQTIRRYELEQIAKHKGWAFPAAA